MGIKVKIGWDLNSAKNILKESSHKSLEIRRDIFVCTACDGRFVRHIIVVKDYGKVKVVNLSSNRGGFWSCPRCGKRFPSFALNDMKMIKPEGLVVWDEKQDISKPDEK